jgi:hypothetical protein
VVNVGRSHPKSVNGVLDLLEVLGCDVDITVRARKE